MLLITHLKAKMTITPSKYWQLYTLHYKKSVEPPPHSISIHNTHFGNKSCTPPTHRKWWTDQQFLVKWFPMVIL